MKASSHAAKAALGAIVVAAALSVTAGSAFASTTRYFCYETGPRTYTAFDTCNQGFAHTLTQVSVLADGLGGCASYNNDASATFSTSRLYMCSTDSAFISLSGTIYRYAINHEHVGATHQLRGLLTYNA
jgi:hypothetical protein